MNAIVVAAIVLLGFVQFSYQQDADHAAFVEKLRAVKEECIKETGVDKDLPRKALHDNDFADDAKLKCYFKCVFTKTGRMNAAGDVDLDALKKMIPSSADKAKAEATIDKCETSTGVDACEKAYNVAKCLREAYGVIKHDK